METTNATHCLTNMSPFNLTRDSGSVMIYSHKSQIYTSCEVQTVSQMAFYARLSQVVGDLFEPPFNWSGIFMAGGLLSGLMDVNYDPFLYKESDLDLYICADTPEKLVKRMKQVVAHISNHVEHAYFIVNGCTNVMLIDCLIRGWNRRLQLIGFDGGNGRKAVCPTAQSVIAGFDLTHCQIAFDGTNVITTPEFILSKKTRETSINPQVSSIHGYRLVKAYLRGYSIARPKHNVFIKNIYHRYEKEPNPITWEQYNPADKSVLPMTDRLWHSHYLEKEFEELLRNPIVQQNLHKNFMIDFSAGTHEHIHQIMTLSDSAQDLYVFNRFGVPLVIRNHRETLVSINLKDALPSDQMSLTLNKCIDRMHIHNVLTR